MSNPADMVTVFRSADRTAADDAAAIVDVLTEAGLNPALLNEDFAGVPVGCYEVRVPPDEEERALDAIDSAMTAEPEPGDPSHSFDLVEIYRGAGTTGEVESVSIRAVLDAAHVPSVLVGSMQLPNLPFRVMVPAVFEEAAQRALSEAAAEGPAGAQAAEAETETQA